MVTENLLEAKDRESRHLPGRGAWDCLASYLSWVTPAPQACVWGLRIFSTPLLLGFGGAQQGICLVFLLRVDLWERSEPVMKTMTRC